MLRISRALFIDVANKESGMTEIVAEGRRVNRKPPRPRQGGGSTITREDVLRARDRRRVLETRSSKHRLHLLWLLAGPGVLVMLGENDGPSMVSYATTGATYGVGFFVPFILLTFIMAFIVQEMTVRLATATHRGHAELIFQR